MKRHWPFSCLGHLGKELHYSWRQMHRSPMFAVTVIGTPALGIAASAAMFTVVDHVLLHPVTLSNPKRIVAILEGTGKEPRGSSSVPWLDIQEWRSRSHSFQRIAFWENLGGRNYLELKTSALPISVIEVSPELFSTPGVEPILGLLVACGPLLRTIYILRHVPLGFRTHHIIVANLDIPSFRFSDCNMSRALYEPLLEEVKQLPGTEATGLMSEVPLENTFSPKLILRMSGNATPTYLKAVSPGIHDVFRFKMAAGRFFDSEDTPTAPTAAVVNETFARLYSPDSHNPSAIVGRKLFSSNRDGKSDTSVTVIGVVRDERQQDMEDPAQPEIDICIPQITSTKIFWYHSMEEVAMDLAVRTSQSQTVVIPELREILKQASPELATATITTMDQIVADSYSGQRLVAHVLDIFGGSALLLCICGLYGLVSYLVAQRTRDIGLRIALGAQRGDLLWLVLREASAMLLAGVMIGSVLTVAVSRLVNGYLYGVSSHDVLTLAASADLLFLAGILAAFLPARRAAKVDPMEALRTE